MVRADANRTARCAVADGSLKRLERGSIARLGNNEMKSRIAVLAIAALAASLQATTNIGQTSRGSAARGVLMTSAIPTQTGTAVLSVASGFVVGRVTK